MSEKEKMQTEELAKIMDPAEKPEKKEDAV